MVRKDKQAFSREINELRNIALTITRDRMLKVKYDTKAQSCCFNYEDNCITLTTNAYPLWVKQNERLCKKLLDSSCMHESLHQTLSKPLVSYVERWIGQLQMQKNGCPNLAREIVNIVEDRKVNYFGKNRYRFDLGKRQELKELIFKDYIEENLETEVAKCTGEKAINGLLIGALCNKGLYNADITPIEKRLTSEQKADLNECLKILKTVEYMRLRIDVVNAEKKIYELVRKHLIVDNDYNTFMVASDGGTLKGDLSQKMKDALKKMCKEEENAERELEKDLQKGEGAGEGTGLEIATPEPDFAKYEELVSEVKPEIERLLSKLKQIVKPKTQQDIYQKRGRIMSNIVARSYTQSIRRQVTNIYVQNTLKLEKEKISLGMLIDYSGSVSRETALKITTVLTEVFGNYVEDYGFAIGCFAEDCQKVKSFFEQFQNTRARIPNISVNPCGTRAHDILESFLKMFNSIHEDRRKILVVASDFCLSDEEETVKIIEQYAKAGIEIIFMGFDNCDGVKTFADKVKGIKRTMLAQVNDLPERFIDVYLNIQKG